MVLEKTRLESVPTNRQQASQRKLRVGLCGAGIGGLAAAIAIARAGCDVTVLEAAAELGEVSEHNVHPQSGWLKAL